VASRAQTWARRTRKDPRRCCDPCIVQSFSEVEGCLQQVASRHWKVGANLQSSSKHRVYSLPAQAPPEALKWAQIPPPSMSLFSSVEPEELLSPDLAPSVQLPVCTGPWAMPQALLPTGPMEVELPQPVGILEHRIAPSSPPWPEFLGIGPIGSPAAAADAKADVDAKAKVDAEVGMESQTQCVNKLVAKLLEFDAWVPGTMAKESTSATGAATASQADARADEHAKARSETQDSFVVCP